jgi:hypothetical protein
VDFLDANRWHLPQEVHSDPTSLMFDHAMNVKRLAVEFCYCSVFDECWSVKGQMREEVKACVPDARLEFVPKPRGR